MHRDLSEQIERLRGLSLAQLRQEYRKLGGDEWSMSNQGGLWRRLVWHIQALKHGGLSECARQRAREIAQDSDRRAAPTGSAGPAPREALNRSPRDVRLPPAGSVLKRPFQGRLLEVTVWSNGFEHEGRQYASLSRLATEITGTRWNGYVFFGLDGRPKAGSGDRRTIGEKSAGDEPAL